MRQQKPKSADALFFLTVLVVGWGLAAPAFALDDAIGERLFKRVWTPAPSSTRANDGLGPLFDGRSCAACHPGDERPHMTLRNGMDLPRGFVVTLAAKDGAPDPVYGHQLQREAVAGVPAEARVRISGYRNEGVIGFSIADPGYGPLGAATGAHLRLAPRLKGLGLMADVAEEAIVAEAERQAKAGLVRGKVARLADGRIGRFGFKAQDADLMSRIAAAFSRDMGLSTPLFPAPAGDCTLAQTACRAAPHGAPDSVGPYEIDAVILGQIGAFLARDVPYAKPPEDGLRLFIQAGCGACHSLRLSARPFYSDLLLHDMGEALSSGAAQGAALPREWRTTPLIGLGETLKAGGRLLHDGRATTLAAAIRLHGGEAAFARDAYLALPGHDRLKLEHFLKGL